jgi:nucleoside-diphosphate-sugar epimerase
MSIARGRAHVQRHFPASPIEFLPSPPQDPTHRCPDLTLANQVIPGWTAGIAYEDGVDRTIEWFRGHMADEHSSATQRRA